MVKRNRDGELHLSLSLLDTAYYPGSWRHPEAEPERLLDPVFFYRLAQTAERGKFDLLYVDHTGQNDYVRATGKEPVLLLEPLTLLTSLASVTEYIGLGTAVATAVHEPYAIARILAVIDHLSHGRTAWFAGTTGAYEPKRQGAGRISSDLPDAEQVERKREFIEVADKLWDSWEDGALLIDKSMGRFLDSDKVHLIHHAGKHFKVRGPLSVPRPPQGRPVSIGVLDGLAELNEADIEGKDLILCSQHTLDEARIFYKLLKEKALSAGRAAHEVKVLIHLFPILGATEQEARDKAAALKELADPVAGLRGTHVFVGTAAQLADWIEEWYQAYGSDGFNLQFPVLPSGLDTFVDEVIPLLQSRGLFRTSYAGRTLRGHLGLKVPAHPYAYHEGGLLR